MEIPQQLREAVELLFRRVPDFAKAWSRDSSFMSYERDDSPYLVFGDFGLFLRQQLDNREHGANQKRFDPSFELIDEMLTSSDPELENLVQVGVLEVLSDHPDAIRLLKSYLSPAGEKKLTEWIRISQNT